MTAVEAWVCLYVDGKQVAADAITATHIPSDDTMAALIAADVLRAARRVIAEVEKQYPPEGDTHE